MTLFSAILARLGLSQSEAADYLGVRIDTVKSWGAGRNPVKPEIYDELRTLADRQRIAAEEIFKLWQSERPARIQFAVPSAKEIARRGWPSEGAFLAVAAHLWAMLPDGVVLDVVPRGSTEAVRAAERPRRNRS